MTATLPPFLADTWWFALTRRWSCEDLLGMARLRVEQGFDTVQVVVGVPPEVGPEHPSAESEAGFPWTLRGELNTDYLALAAERIAALNDLGLRVVVYGAWGHQIRWLGTAGMAAWWRALVEHLDGLDVIWCLTGEADLWLGTEGLLLPDRCTDGSDAPGPPSNPRWRRALRRLLRGRRLAARRADWTRVLVALTQSSARPVFVHTTPRFYGSQLVNRPELLAAETLQTGHDEGTRNHLWQRVLAAPGAPVINLEPWYEGITGRFGASDQLHAYWCSMLSGAHAACYGAHGMWNVGDGCFLAHWGDQTYQQARALDTPRLLGASHATWLPRRPVDDETATTVVSMDPEDPHRLASLARGQALYVPEASRTLDTPAGDVWLPLQGRFSDELPTEGPAVIFSA